MTKTELIGALAERAGVTKTQAKKVLDAFWEVVSEALKKGEEVNIPGMGKFYLSERSERKGRNPRTGEVITIPARKLPAFKVGSELKKAVS